MRDGIAASMRMEALVVMKLRGVIGRDSSCVRLYEIWERSMPAHDMVVKKVPMERKRNEMGSYEVKRATVTEQHNFYREKAAFTRLR